MLAIQKTIIFIAIFVARTLAAGQFSIILSDNTINAESTLTILV